MGVGCRDLKAAPTCLIAPDDPALLGAVVIESLLHGK